MERNKAEERQKEEEEEGGERVRERKKIEGERLE